MLSLKLIIFSFPHCQALKVFFIIQVMHICSRRPGDGSVSKDLTVYGGDPSSDPQHPHKQLGVVSQAWNSGDREIPGALASGPPS